MRKPPRPLRIEGDVAYVPLTKGYEAIIDAGLATSIGQYRWYAHEEFRPDGTLRAVYATRHRNVSLHHAVLAHALAGSGLLADHRNGNTLDCRRDNLRPATAAENAQNRPAQSNNTLGVKGVVWSKKSRKYEARIKAHGVRHYLGAFRCITAAALAYAKASRVLHGEFGRPA